MRALAARSYKVVGPQNETCSALLCSSQVRVGAHSKIFALNPGSLEFERAEVQQTTIF